MAATTQDGVRVFLLEKAVSKGPFKTVYGEQDIIFNKAHYVCLSIQCDQQDDDQLLKINAGEAFKGNTLDIAGTVVYELIGNRGNRNSIDEITGYISKKELDELNHKSVVTYATLRHPRYGLTSTEANNINTECGEIVKKNDKKSVDTISDAEQKLISAFRVADVGNQNLIRFNRGYGGENKEVVYRLYNVVDRRVQPNIETTYAALVVFKNSKVAHWQDTSLPVSIEVVEENTVNA